jgi:hypothetical protein
MVNDMKLLLLAVGLALSLSACQESSTPQFDPWPERIDPWMTEAGWSLERFEQDNYYTIRKNDVDVWSDQIYCSRGCVGGQMHLPVELDYAARQQFAADLARAETAYLELMSAKTGLVPIEPPKNPDN